jgi:hypothetical protein
MNKREITPALNDEIIKRADAIYQASGIFTRKSFNIAYDKAVIEFGYTPAYFKRVMSKNFIKSDN